MKKLILLVMCAFVAGMAFADEPPLYKTLETDGRGYILTDYQPKTGRSRIEYDLRFLYLGLPFGLGIANGTSSSGATNDKEWGGYFNAETRTFTYYTAPGDACANFGEGFCDTSVRHTVSMGQGWVSLDDKTNTIATAADDYTTGGRFALFAANFGGTTFSAKAIVRVAGIRIFEDDTLVRDWVPAKDANGTATLYDLVNGKFETVKAGVFSVDDTVDPTWEAQAANGWTVQPTVPASIAAGTLPTISLGTAEFGDGTQTATYTAKDIQNLPAGTYTQVVEVASMVGYRGLREELTFTVTGTVPTAASTAPTAVAPLGGVSVATHTAKQQEFIGLPAATRKRVLSVLYERERAEYAANDGHPQSVRLRWDGGDGACTIHVYRGNETTPVQTHAVVTRWTEGNFFDLDNLEVGRTYRWTVTNEKGTSGGTFATEDETPRLFNAGVVGNTRDLGGYVGLDGRRVRQGMFLRSRCFDTNERTTYGSILTATEEAFFCDFIGLKTVIDLRGDTWITKSFVPGVTTRVNTAWPLDYTGAFLTDAAKKSAMKAALNPIFDAAKYPIDVHCHSGQDRTGMYCFILEALLGVSEEDCIRDWEYSALGNSGFNASDTYQLDSFLEKFRSLNGATTQAKAETFMKWLGYSSTLIDAFREIMLENERPCTVTIGDHPHLTAAWTSGDGSVTNEIAGTTFGVVEGTTNVKVIFTADSGYEIVGEAVVNLGTVTEDITFGDGNDYRAPEVRDVCGWCGIDGEAWYFRGGVPLWRIEAAYNEGVMSLRQRNADASGTLDLWGIERALADVGIGPVPDATLTFESTWGTNGFANVTELIITNRHFAANYPVGSLKPFAGISRLVLGDGETDLTVGSRDVSDPVVTASCSVFGTNFDTLESVEIWGRDVRLRNAFCCYAANATARLADVRVHATGDLDLGWNSFNVSTGSKGGTISNAVFEAGGDLDLGGRALRYSLVSNALVSVSAPPGARVVLGGPHFIGQYNKKMPVTLDWYAPPPVVEDPSALCDSTITWRFPVERAEEYAGIFQGREKFVTISDPGCRLSVALPPSESADSTADRRDKYGSWQQLKTADTSADSDGGGTAYWHRFLRIEPGASPTLRPGSGQASFTFVAENTGEMDAALRSVRIESPDIDIISDEDYARYFFVRTEPLGNNRYQLTAVLDPGAVEVESVVKRLAAQLPCETASLAGSPGLWYFVEQAERLEDLGKSFSKPVQANCDGTFSLELAPFKDSAFYRLHVKASESESSADR